MILRWLLFLLFIAIVAGLAWVRWEQGEDVGWKAIVTIPKNTRLTKDHVQLRKGRTPLTKLDSWDAIGGRYTSRQFSKGETVPVDGLANAPVIEQDKDHRIVAYPLTSLGAAASLVNAGVTVVVCEKASDECVDGLVAAVSGEREAEAGLLLLTTSDARKLAKLKQPLLYITSLP